MSFLFSMLFYITNIKIYTYLCTFLCGYILLLLSCFGCSQYILLLSIIQSSFYDNHTTWSYDKHIKVGDLDIRYCEHNRSHTIIKGSTSTIHPESKVADKLMIDSSMSWIWN